MTLRLYDEDVAEQRGEGEGLLLALSGAPTGDRAGERKELDDPCAPGGAAQVDMFCFQVSKFR